MSLLWPKRNAASLGLFSTWPEPPQGQDLDPLALGVFITAVGLADRNQTPAQVHGLMNSCTDVTDVTIPGAGAKAALHVFSPTRAVSCAVSLVFLQYHSESR